LKRPRPPATTSPGSTGLQCRPHRDRKADLRLLATLAAWHFGPVSASLRKTPSDQAVRCWWS